MRKGFEENEFNFKINTGCVFKSADSQDTKRSGGGATTAVASKQDNKAWRDLSCLSPELR
jgi:hypothetical protein